MKVAIYLRKSRADEELEKTLGEGETLIKHRKALLKFAKEKKLNIVEIKEEIESADSIFFRPKMIELLKEVESGLYDGVLVMDIQRLGRGDTEDQGVITRIFKESHTKIITPRKTYNLDDDIDEDYFEFESFMGRKEYKMIKKRMQGGRARSVEDGNYISPNPPFGYEIGYINRNRSLVINEKEAEIVRLIFKKYCEGNGGGVIADYLNSLGYKTKANKDFERSSIIFILKNPIYIGKVTWKKKEIKKSKNPNKVKDTKTRDKSEWIVADGKHKSIIDEQMFNKAQEILSNKYHVPYQIINGPANPLAGLVICGVCGNKMMMRKYGNKPPHLICNKKCGNKSAKFEYIEDEVIKSLEEYLKNVKTSSENLVHNDNVALYENQMFSLKKDLATLNSQKLKLFDLLEQGIYDNQTFVERSQNISNRSVNIENEINNIESIIQKLKEKSDNKTYAKLENVISAYKTSRSITQKNELLKSILIKIEYRKAKEQKGDDFEIRLHPRV
jgi:DNA invertase Pin-like site-specific DNA recombinase